jgi:hypothetical protein
MKRYDGGEPPMVNINLEKFTKSLEIRGLIYESYETRLKGKLFPSEEVKLILRGGKGRERWSNGHQKVNTMSESPTER